MSVFFELFKNEDSFSSLIDSFNGNTVISALGIDKDAYSLFAGSLASQTKKKLLFVLPYESDAKALYNRFSCKGKRAAFLPARDFELIFADAVSRDFSLMRLDVLKNVTLGDLDVIFTSVEALLQQTLPKSEFERTFITLKTGEEYKISDLTDKLLSLGYKRFDQVEGEGQFSVRGGIADIFVSGEKEPFRVEFFADEIDDIRCFDVISQRRSKNSVKKIDIFSAKETYFSADSLEKIKERLSEEKNGEDPEFALDSLNRLELSLPLAFDVFYPLVYKKSTFIDYLSDFTFVLFNPSELKLRLENAENLINESFVSFTENKKCRSFTKDPRFYGDFSLLIDAAEKNGAVLLEPFFEADPVIRSQKQFNFSVFSQSFFEFNFELLKSRIDSLTEKNYKIIFLLENSVSAKSFYETVLQNGYNAFLILKEKISFGDLKEGCIYIINKDLYPEAFGLSLDFKSIRTALFSPKSKKTKNKTKSDAKDKTRQKIISYAELKIGDYVVHNHHGIGIFAGIEQIGKNGTKSDYIKIKFAGTDVLFVPCNSLDNISKYIGSENNSVKLNKLGGFEWQKTKQKTKENVKSIARELIKLYSERRSAKGFAFSRDNSLMREFENEFEYTETQSQLIAIKEIKEDMQKPYPMERLLCGDVGFGKTEVAMRAAFKCVNDSKQVAVLAPTTILAWQHYQTFCERFKNFPVKIDLLCRLVNGKAQKQTLKELKEGKTDIIIGTHRLLQDDVSFSDLGLLIVDEEQRFGVSHKEKLKKTAVNVDSLSLSATPIPRTMSLSLSSIIDMSTLEDVPGERFPVQSFVLQYDFDLLADAMQKEMDRGGVTFYLLNNTSLLDETAAKIQKRLPDARIETAHGKMDKEHLLSIWKDLTLGNVDILVCTTIIETGIDLHSANTLIIENADHFGLSQLHQIRGRVGRSDKRAYAYFTYKKDKVVNETAEKRLNAIRQYTEFCSGFKLALVDLEIRGAGNLLDKEQHGHLNNVGYDMYMKLLSDAILYEKGEKEDETRDCSVDLLVSAYFDSAYIREERTRMEFYKKIASAENDEEAEEVESEITDRFGAMPKPSKNLFLISKIRRTAKACGIDRIVQDGEHVKFFCSRNEKVLHLLNDKYFFVLKFFAYKPPFYELLINKDKVLSETQAFLDDFFNAIKEDKK